MKKGSNRQYHNEQYVGMNADHNVSRVSNSYTTSSCFAWHVFFSSLFSALTAALRFIYVCMQVGAYVTMWLYVCMYACSGYGVALSVQARTRTRTHTHTQTQRGRQAPEGCYSLQHTCSVSFYLP